MRSSSEIKILASRQRLRDALQHIQSQKVIDFKLFKALKADFAFSNELLKACRNAEIKKHYSGKGRK